MSDVIKYRGFRIIIGIEEDSMNPREFDGNIGVMICSHKRYDLGDVEKSKEFDFDECSNWDDVREKIIEENDNGVLILPLYLLDHSGLAISTTPFSSYWDSGQIGFIYCSFDKIKEFYNDEENHLKVMENALEILREEVKLYDAYLSGQVYYFTVVEEKDLDNVIMSCGGFYGNTDDLVSYAKEEVDLEIKNKLHNHFRRLKRQINNKVPLVHRNKCEVVW